MLECQIIRMLPIRDPRLTELLVPKPDTARGNGQKGSPFGIPAGPALSYCLSRRSIPLVETIRNGQKNEHSYEPTTYRIARPEARYRS